MNAHAKKSTIKYSRIRSSCQFLQSSSDEQLACYARCRIYPDGTGESIGVHSNHEDHEKIYFDKKRIQAMKDDIDKLVDIIPTQRHKIGIHEIFNHYKSS